MGEDALASMTLEEKAGQVFCPMGFASDEETLRHIVCEIGVGGMMYRSGFKAEIQETHRKIQSMAKIPLLLAASLNQALLTGLLRSELGFNGLISTDSSAMVGFTVAMPRSVAVPTAIAAGADVVLFNKSLSECHSEVCRPGGRAGSPLEKTVRG